MNDYLRHQCKILKAVQGVSYKELAELLEVRQDSFYSWLKGYYDYSDRRQSRLKEILDTIKET